jgi:hypothetical protein
LRIKGNIHDLYKAVQLSTKLVDYSNIVRPYALIRAEAEGCTLVAQAGGRCFISFEAEVIEPGQAYVHQGVLLPLIGEQGNYELWLEGSDLHANLETPFGKVNGFIPTIEDGQVDLKLEEPAEWIDASKIARASYVCANMPGFPIPAVRAQGNSIIAFDDHGGGTFGVVIDEGAGFQASIPYKPAIVQWLACNLEELAVQDTRLWGRGPNWIAHSVVSSAAPYSDTLVEKLTTGTSEPIFETGVKTFADALRSVMFFSRARESGNRSIVRLATEGGQVEIRSPRTEIGERVIHIDAKVHEEFSGVYCADHLVAALDQFDEEVVVFARSDIKFAIVLQDGSTKHIVMGRMDAAFEAIKEAINAQTKAASETAAIPF